MQTTSQTWKTLWASGNAHIETVAVIAGTTYTEISNPVISRAVMQNNLSVGNAVSASCVFSVRTSNSIPRSAEVQIKIRLTDGVTTSEWLTQGTFYISRRSVDPVTGVITLECYDALLKTNADMPALLPWTTQAGDVVTTNSGEWLYFSASYPRNMADLLNDLLLILGLELDARTVINTGAIYTIDSVDAGMSIHDVFCKIAAANGGNWIITPENKLRLVPLISAAGAQTSANAVQVNGVIGDIGVGTSGTITGVRYDISGQKILVGADTGIVLDADVSAAVAQALYTKINGYTYQSYSFSGAIYDPAAELGDYLNRLDNVHSVLYIETATLGATYRGTISAPDPGEISDEYPYIGGASKTLAAAKAYAQQVAEEKVNNLDDSLNQLSIFNRLTGGGAVQGLYLYDGKVYLNASYIKSGTMVADFIKGGLLTMGGSNNVNGSIIILDASGNTIGTWNNNGINATAGTFSGDITGATGTFIGEMSASGIKGGTLTLGGANNVNGKVYVKDANGNVIGTWNNNGIVIEGGQFIASTQMASTDRRGLFIDGVGHFAIGLQPDSMSDFDGNKCGFQVSSDGIVKLSDVYLYGPDGNHILVERMRIRSNSDSTYGDYVRFIHDNGTSQQSPIMTIGEEKIRAHVPLDSDEISVRDALYAYAIFPWNNNPLWIYYPNEQDRAIDVSGNSVSIGSPSNKNALLVSNSGVYVSGEDLFVNANSGNGGNLDVDGTVGVGGDLTIDGDLDVGGAVSGIAENLEFAHKNGSSTNYNVLPRYVKLGRLVTIAVEVRLLGASASELSDFAYGFPEPLCPCTFAVSVNSTPALNVMKCATLDTSGYMSLIGSYNNEGDYIYITGSYIATT